MHKKLLIITSLLLAALPLASLAFSPGNQPNVVASLSILDLIDILFNTIWPVIVAILIFAGIGVAFMFFNAQGDPDKIAQARLALIGIVIVCALTLLAFSIPFIVRNTLGNNI